MLAVLLPLTCFSLLVPVFRTEGRCLRGAVLSAAVVWGALVAAMTEMLSILRALDRAGLVVCWGAAVAATAGIALVGRKQGVEPVGPSQPLGRLTPFVAGTATIVLLTGLVALLAAPNNFDSMTYHLGRVMHWIQNRSVAHYPTHITRQLYSTPWAEFAVTHLMILWGGDRLANLVQWFSMAGSIVGATLIAARLGADPRGQLFAAVAVATIPMGILQSSSTQNDYVTAFWLVCFVYFGLLLKERLAWHNALMAGTSLGLAILTKETAYLYAFPFLLWFGGAVFRASCRRGIGLALGGAALVLALNAGHYLRNYGVFGDPLSSDGLTFANGRFSAAAVVSNAVRNLVLHLATPFDGADRAVESGVAALHRSMGIDVNDPGTTWRDASFKLNRLGILHEDFAGNLLHLLLITASSALLATSARLRKQVDLVLYLAALLAGSLLFCGYLRWQPFNSRLHLPLFVLWAPIVAVVLSGLRAGKRADAAMVLLLVCAIPWVFYNATRPLVALPEALLSHFARGIKGNGSIVTTARSDQYFNSKPSVRQTFVETAAQLNAAGCRSIGLKIGADDWEYPLWMMVRSAGHELPRFEHIDVANRSGRIGVAAFKPAVVVSTGTDGKMALTVADSMAHEKPCTVQ